jgi:polysaccharide export outer membrane protein
MILSPNIKELDKYKAVVRPDGKISLNLLGEVKVSGSTPDQINKVLRDMAAKYYVNPDIKVEVVANSKFYLVVGSGVNAGGKKPFTGNDSIIRAVAEAGFNDGAWPQQVLLSRPSKHATAVVDFKKMFEYGDLAQNYRLEQGDIIDVRDSPLTKFNKDLDKVIGPFTGASAVVGSGATVAHPTGN